MPPPVENARLLSNPFTGESIENDDTLSMTSSRMSSRSSASRLGRDGDSQVRKYGFFTYGKINILYLERIKEKEAKCSKAISA